MKQIHQKIEERKRSISSKKRHLSQEYEAAKRRLTSGTGLSLAALGGVAVGFLLLPKKFRILKSVAKAYYMATTLKGVLDLIPHKVEIRKHHTHRSHKDN